MNKKIVQLGVMASVMLLVLVAGCVSDQTEGQAFGSFSLLISDEEADIDDFESLNVTIEKFRIEPTNRSLSPITKTFEESKRVDLTTVTGDLAKEIIRTKAPTGNYSKVELYVEDKFDSPGKVRKTEGRVKQSVVESEEGPRKFVNQQDVKVMVPSGKLQIEKNFVVAPNSTVDFVFDMHVVLKGATGEYNLEPNIAGSGVEGKDLPEHKRRE